ncbi:MAG: TonB-dependent receptor [Pseudomonadales bacterium]
MTIRHFTALALCCASATAVAENADPSAGNSKNETVRLETVVVTAHPLSAEGLALAAEILEDEELARKLQSSIGETVGYEPGVHSASFGQAASRPVIHGLSGPRVRILEDRIDSLDVSVTSADHAVTIEPFIADRIEILKGPSTLLYGSGAIGGVVDVHTGRIPHEIPEEGFAGRFEGRLGDNADRETAALRLDGGTDGFAWHADGFTRKADEYDIPGFAESAVLRALEEEDGGGTRDQLPGSALDVAGGAFGAAFVGDRGFAGAAVSWLNGDYGLPGGHDAHEEGTQGGAEETEGNPLLDLKQTRIDLEAGVIDPFAGFTSLNVRVGINDYEHQEIEPDGAVATVFDNEAVEARIELTHRPVARWNGALGVQVLDRDFSAIGEEAFIAPVDTRAIGAFWVGERSFERFDLEAGVRLETVTVDPSVGSSLDFTAYAASLGTVIPFAGSWSLGLLADYSARAPIAEELFSNGPHLATGAFEVGDASLDGEKALNLSANLRYAGDGWLFNSTLYYTDFSDFIYETPTGAEEDGLPVFVFRQDDAEFVGFDAEIEATIATWERGSLALSAMFDTVSASLDIAGNDDIPRLPPTRYGIGASGSLGIVRASIDYLWVEEQDDIADFELPTDEYRDLRAFLGADFRLGSDRQLTLFVQGRNLTDDDQRQHSSFIKDLAPLPGRTLEAGIRARF